MKKKEFKFYPSMFKGPKKRPRGFGRVCTIDTENVGLLPALHLGRAKDGHCIICRDKETQEVFVFFDPYEKRDKDKRVWLDEWEGEQDGFYKDGITFINELDVVISQNWQGYDSFALEKLHPGVLKVDYKALPRGGKKRRRQYPFRVMDTLIMSQLLNPDRKPPATAYQLGKGNVGPHTIEAHGMRMNRYKPENEDWSRLTDHIIHRCLEDTAIGEDFYDYLWKEWIEQEGIQGKGGLRIRDAYRCELVLYKEMQQQAIRGFRLDIPACMRLVKKLDKEIKVILKNAMPHIPFVLCKKPINHIIARAACLKAGYKYKTKKHKRGSTRLTMWSITTVAGHYTNKAKADYPELVGNENDTEDPIVGGPYTPVVFKQVSLGNREAVRKSLYAIGWRGVNLTKKEDEYFEKEGELPYYYAGKLDQPSMEAWESRLKKQGKKRPPKWAVSILKYYILTSRRSQILNPGDVEYYEEHNKWPVRRGQKEHRGLVPHAMCSSSGKTIAELVELYGIAFIKEKGWDKDGEYRVPAIAFPIGTPTFRMRHKVVVNIPARGLYGKEMRELFIASKGFRLLGIDASGIELRMLAHYMGDESYKKVILNGDIHTHNQKLAGIIERFIAKIFIYAFIYGAGIPKLAWSCGMSVKDMRRTVKKFLKSLPQLKELIDGVKKAAREKGYVRCSDGRLGHIRFSGGKIKEHTALNMLLQMMGSVCVRWSLYLSLEALEKAGIEARLVANVHDEIQLEVREEDIEYITYKINNSEWEVEEKKDKKTKEGKYYSAPIILKEGKKKTTVQRSYTLTGHLMKLAFREAGVYLGITIPLDAEYKTGLSWAETH